jgi:hypothetical protein
MYGECEFELLLRVDSKLAICWLMLLMCLIEVTHVQPTFKYEVLRCTRMYSRRLLVLFVAHFACATSKIRSNEGMNLLLGTMDILTFYLDHFIIAI